MSAKKKRDLPETDSVSVNGKALLPVSRKEFLDIIRRVEKVPLASGVLPPELINALRSLFERELSIVQMKVLSDVIKRLEKQADEEIGAVEDIKRSSAAMVRNMDTTLALLQRSSDNLSGALQ